MKKIFTLFAATLLSAWATFAQDPMVLVFDTNLSTGTTITLPLNGTVNVTVDWGDGTQNTYVSPGHRAHIYDSNGEYTVSISGTLTQFASNWTYPNADKLVKVISFGNLGLTSLAGAFRNAVNLTEVPEYLPNTVVNLSSTFWGATSFNFDIGNWDVSNVTNMNYLFFEAGEFNQDIGSWDVSSVTGMNSIFRNAGKFNQDIGDWEVSNVTDMSMMFYDAQSFNQDIGNWNVSRVTNMSEMFYRARLFNQDIGGWDVSSVSDMKGMFNGAYVFNYDIGSWDVSKVINMEGLFFGANAFNQDIGDWDVSNVVIMSWMFVRAFAFNQDIGSWDVGRVTNMTSMFSSAQSFNQDIGGWDVSNVTDMSNMLGGVSLTTANYNSILQGWATRVLKNGVNLYVDINKYSIGEPAIARQQIIDTYGWVITDGGPTEEPAIKTLPISDIKPYSAASGGLISQEGGSPVTNRGLVWHTQAKPTLTQCMGYSYAEHNEDNFTSLLHNLLPNTTYYVRAFAENTQGIGYGEQIIFITSPALVFEFNTTLASGTMVSLPLLGNVNLTVDWGDGNVEKVTTPGIRSHTYAKDSSYLVTLYGTLSQLGNGSNTYPDIEKLVALTRHGCIGLTSLSGAFNGAVNLERVPDQLSPLVTNLSFLFKDAKGFTQDISGWDVSGVTTMEGMFSGATGFSHDISGWIVSQVTGMENMFSGVTLPIAVYNSVLSHWSQQDLQPGVTLHAGESKYSLGEPANARQHIIDTFGWTIIDGGTSGLPSVATLTPASIHPTSATLLGEVLESGDSEVSARGFVWHTQPKPTLSENIGHEQLNEGSFKKTVHGLNPNTNYYVRAYATNNAGTEYGQQRSFTTLDAAMVLVINTYLSAGTTITLPISGQNLTVDWGDGNGNEYLTTGTTHHIYEKEGEYHIRITGNLSSFGRWSEYPNSHKIVRVKSFGDSGLTSLAGAFYNAENLIEVPNSLPSSVTNLYNTFYGAKILNSNVGDWDVSNVTSMYRMFYNAKKFNQDISNWDVRNVTDMRGMFAGAGSFNQDIGNWDVSKVTNMGSSGGYDGMFSSAGSFNQDISRWDVSNVTDMSYMFYMNASFNQNIGSWDVSKVRNMQSMFSSARSFNQDIGNWDVSSVTNMHEMFRYSRFNHDISSWDVSKVTNMRGMFEGTAFNQPLAAWDVSSVTNMRGMFFEASSFNQPINNWDVSSVTNMSRMFWLARSFNQPLDDWDVSKVTDMSYMFSMAYAFNQNIGSWDVSNVSNMIDMFSGSKLATVNYNSLLRGWGSRTLKTGISFHGGNSNYSPGQPNEARQHIIDTFGWTITDGGISNLPVITTAPVTDITPSTATSGGEISNIGGSDVTARGIVWHTQSNPTINTNLGITFNDEGPGNFTGNLSDLELGTAYNVRAYATNENGTDYGPSIRFTASQELLISGGFIANSKEYDGTVMATLLSNSLTLQNTLAEHTNVSLTKIQAEFDNKNVGSGKTVAIASASLEGEDAHKYYITFTGAPTSTAIIISKQLTIGGSFTAKNKNYDGTDMAEIDQNKLSLLGVIRKDDVNLFNLHARFAQVEVGSNIPVTIYVAALEGNDKANYRITTDGAPTTTANIMDPTNVIHITTIGLRAYPNPFSNHIYLEAEEPITRVTITSITGQVMHDQQLMGDNLISMGNLPGGLYLVTVEFKGGLQRVVKMIKQ